MQSIVRVPPIAIVRINVFFNSLLIRKPTKAESVVITIIIPATFRNLKSTRFRFDSIKMFMVDALTDINKYPTIKAYVPINLGRIVIEMINRSAETT